MNNKHIACLVIALLCVLVIQGVSMVRKRAIDMQKAAQVARQEADTAALTLRGQRAVLDDLKNKTGDLIEYLAAWEPHFSNLSTPQAGEINVNSLIKQANLILLAQRFEVVPNKTDGTVPNAANATIPQIVRVHLTIEDEFVKTMNWLGEVESQLPIARVSNLGIERGQSGNDVRLNLVLDIPQAIARATPAPKP